MVPVLITESDMLFGPFDPDCLWQVEKSELYKQSIRTISFDALHLRKIYKAIVRMRWALDKRTIVM